MCIETLKNGNGEINFKKKNVMFALSGLFRKPGRKQTKGNDAKCRCSRSRGWRGVEDERKTITQTKNKKKMFGLMGKIKKKIIFIKQPNNNRV